MRHSWLVIWVCWPLAAVVPPAQAGSPGPELRQAVRQGAKPAPQPQPRKLSAEERAQLRRQLAEFGRPSPRRP